MPVILLVLGVVTAVAGLMLTARGVTVHDGTIDSDIITPGVIAGVGGLLLIGLGLLVRVLQRIERALAARPAARPTEASSADAAAVRFPFPPKPMGSPQPVSAGANVAPAPAEDAAVERLRVKFPGLSRPENAAVVEGAEASLTAYPHAEEESAEEKSSAAVGRGRNGASPARVAPRFELKARAPLASDQKMKASVFPVAAVRREPDAAAQPAQAPVVVSQQAPAAETVAAPSEQPAAASVLKSGVVEGMAYTLYSDGSIEAQLPQGTLRFGSISALRSHIENAS